MTEASTLRAGDEIEVVAARPTRGGRVGRTLVGIVTSSVFLGLLLAVCSWTTGSRRLQPGGGIDGSWNAALAMAAHQRLHFGSQIVFTFGPLGFLSRIQLYYTETALLAFVFVVVMKTSVFTTLIIALRTRVNLVVAVFVAYVCGYTLTSLWGGPEMLLAVMFVASVRLLSRARDSRFIRWQWLAFGAVAGLMSLQKVSVGVAVGVLAVVTVVCAPSRRRQAALSLGDSALFVFLAAWFATGNRLGDLVSYVRTTKEVGTGYTAVSLSGSPAHRYDVWLGLVLAGGLFVVACLYARRLHTARRARVGIVVATLVVTWPLFKEGFVRQDHRLVWFAALPLLLAAFVSPPGDEVERARTSARAWSWGVVAGMLVLSLVAFNVSVVKPQRMFRPQLGLRDFSDTVVGLALPSRRHEIRAAGMERLHARYAIPPEMVARTAGQTVDIDPLQQAVAWAYPTMRWTPLPTIQSYNASTSALDRLDVDFIASSRAPRFILRSHPAAIDNRLPFFEQPTTQVAIACRYREVAASRKWQLLERGANRCGPPIDLGSVSARFGDDVPVPPAPPGSVVAATFDLATPLWWSVANIAYKPPPVRVAINGQPVRHRFVTATAGDLHIVSVPPTLGYNPDFVPRPYTSFAFFAGDGSRPKVTAHFYAVPIRSAPPAS